MDVHTLDENFIKHFKITNFYQGRKDGGQKMVYFPVIDGQQVVLKYFPFGYDERIQREMRIYEEFKHHPGIPKIHSIEKYGTNTIVFEEFIPGSTLSDIIHTYKGKNELVKDCITKSFDIMAPIWEADYVHRDLKPQNIIITPTGDPVIIDFGIARDLNATSLTATGFQPRTWNYASPEQYSGDKKMISYRTDFFSLGVIAHALYHNCLPFGDTESEIENKFQSLDESFQQHDDFPLREFCSAALRFRPADRPRLITDLYKLL